MDAYDHIEDYLAGKLNAEHQAAFEHALSTDAELESLVANFATITKVSEAVLEEKLLAEVRKVSDSKPEEQSITIHKKIKEKPQVKNWLRLSLLAIAIIVAAYYFTQNTESRPESKDEQLLIAQIYREPLWPTRRGVDSKDFLALGVQAFNKDDELAAIAYLTDSVANSAEGKYWLAELFLKDEQYEKSMDFLPSSIEGSLYGNRLIYLKVLNLIGQGKMKEAKGIYQKLSPDYKNLFPKDIFSN